MHNSMPWNVLFLHDYDFIFMFLGFSIGMYSLHPKISVVLAFKFCPTKNVVLAFNEIHLIKAILSTTKKVLYSKTHRAN